MEAIEWEEPMVLPRPLDVATLGAPGAPGAPVAETKGDAGTETCSPAADAANVGWKAKHERVPAKHKNRNTKVSRFASVTLVMHISWEYLAE